LTAVGWERLIQKALECSWWGVAKELGSVVEKVAVKETPIAY
jgi:hypothetical protein